MNMARGITFVFHIIIELCLLLSYPVVGIANIFSKNTRIETSGNQKPTIIILERWMQANFMHKIGKKYLESKGFNVYLISHSIKEGTFEQSAKQLKKFIDTQQLSEITLVGISSGGISALLYLQEHNGWDKANKFISIGTPFRGTLFALPIALSQSCRELLPWSPVVKKIKNMHISNSEKIVCLVAQIDELVPRTSAVLPTTTMQVIKVIGHNYLHLLCKETYKTIADLAKKSA